MESSSCWRHKWWKTGTVYGWSKKVDNDFDCNCNGCWINTNTWLGLESTNASSGLHDKITSNPSHISICHYTFICLLGKLIDASRATWASSVVKVALFWEPISKRWPTTEDGICKTTYRTRPESWSSWAESETKKCLVCVGRQLGLRQRRGPHLKLQLSIHCISTISAVTHNKLAARTKQSWQELQIIQQLCLSPTVAHLQIISVWINNRTLGLHNISNIDHCDINKHNRLSARLLELQ